ncbi:MAG: alpha/beta fold hydrolase BchO, partial [Gemmobacter sp.]
MKPLSLPPFWPGRDGSRRIAARPHLWHVQVQGEGPPILLLHGAGGASHSWRALAPALAPHYTLVAPDLPGQGFTTAGSRSRMSLPAMAEDIAALLARENWRPAAIIGHSAGAALALRLAEILQGPPAVVGINAALSPFQGVAGVMFPMMARLLAMNPFIAPAFARLWRNTAQVDRLIRATGSAIDPEGLACYLHLVRDPGHVDGTLAMMAQWRLDGLLARLPRIAAPVLLVTAEDDRAVPPDVSAEAAARLPAASRVALAAGGHLVHETDPGPVADAILRFLAAEARR